MCNVLLQHELFALMHEMHYREFMTYVVGLEPLEAFWSGMIDSDPRKNRPPGLQEE